MPDCHFVLQEPHVGKSALAFEVGRACPDDRLAIQRMLELYQHDLSDIWDQDLDAHGEYGYALDRYWSKSECRPFVIWVDRRYAGFALIDNAVKIGMRGHWIDQFFILKKYRRKGLGSAVATHVFDELPGEWEVGQMLQNHPAQSFWRRVIAEYTEGEFTEHKLAGPGWQGFVQCLRSPRHT